MHADTFAAFTAARKGRSSTTVEEMSREKAASGLIKINQNDQNNASASTDGKTVVGWL